MVLLTSMFPSEVSCMGVSAAVALGFDDRYCASMPPCSGTAPTEYFGTDSLMPFADFGLRPTMILAARDEPGGQALIDRGLAAESSFPLGHGWFVNTSDSVRSVRWERFVETVERFGEQLELVTHDNSAGGGSDLVADQEGVLFYFTGLREVGSISTNSYRPGAVADHLTSFGGQLPDSQQMSIIAWLEAGATASFGTAHEPCAFPAKFPDTLELLRHYLNGNTVGEAYWKSVRSPGEGNFVGDPLARPFGGYQDSWDGVDWAIRTGALREGRSYLLQGGDSAAGLFVDLYELPQLGSEGIDELVIEEPSHSWYRLLES